MSCGTIGNNHPRNSGIRVPAARQTDAPRVPSAVEFWTAQQYATAAGLPLRTARWRLARWHRDGGVRVVQELSPATGAAAPRPRYMLDVADWRRVTGIVAARAA